MESNQKLLLYIFATQELLEGLSHMSWFTFFSVFSEKAFRNCQLTIVAVLPSTPSNKECQGPDTISFSLDKVYLINPWKYIFQ